MTDTLFYVPPNKTRLELLKEQHGIETHHCEHLAEGIHWIAVLMAPCRKMGYGVTDKDSIPELYSKVGRLIDEAEYSGYGATERDAVFEVCRSNNISMIL